MYYYINKYSYKNKKMIKEKKIQVVLLGDSAVGKTSILRRIRDRTFNDDEFVTVAVDYFYIHRKYERTNTLINLECIDSNGRETSIFLSLHYISKCHIILLVFSNVETLNILIERWHKYYKNKINIDSKIILIGNKSDIFGDEREEIMKLGREFAEEIDAFFTTCSAKNGENMDNVERFIITEANRITN